MSDVFGLPSVRIGRLFGIPLEVDASWFFILFLVASTLTASYLPSELPDQSVTYYALVGFGVALIFFVCLTLHEFAHALVARAGGLSISRVTLFLFGGVSQLEDEPRTPRQELLMSLAGPVASLVLAGVFWLAGYGLREAGASGAVLVPVEYLSLINFYLVAFNILPGYPLDGGRVLRAIIWGVTGDLLKATKWASRIGQLFGMGLVAIAVFGVLSGAFNLIWFAVLGWFLATLASASYREEELRSALSAVPLRAVMSSPVDTISGEMTVEELLSAFFRGGRHRRHPVVVDGRTVGLMDVDFAREIARSQWSTTRVADVALTDLSRIVAGPDRPVSEVLGRLAPSGPGAILVVEQGRLAGIVTRSDVVAHLRGPDGK